MAYLYKNLAGEEVTRHSFSAGSDFRKCPRLYQLKRILGWREKEDRATMRFGNILESAIQQYHNQVLCPGITKEYFTQAWTKIKQVEGVDYGESSWEEMLFQGQEMGMLYEKLLPNLPIHNPKFQLNYRKELYPNTYLGGIQFTAYIDMLSSWPDTSENGKLIIDIKSSGRDLQSNLLSLDPQLRRYAWVTGIPDVAFLWFTRTSATLKGGHRVTSLITGEPLVILAVEDKSLILLSPEIYEKYDKANKGIKGKAADSIKQSFAESDQALLVPTDKVTKQKLSFFQGIISKEEQEDSGNAVGREVAEIVAAREANKYPQHCGIRFPDDNCLHCPMRGICGHDDKLRDELLITPPTKPDPDWVKEFLED
jgi:hypothetical protein